MWAEQWNRSPARKEDILVTDCNNVVELCSTPNAEVEMIELRNVIGPLMRSEKRSVVTTRYNDIAVIKIACALDIPLKTGIIGCQFATMKFMRREEQWVEQFRYTS
jgi:hypothetical protein